jgi:anti-sigma factor RsiW
MSAAHRHGGESCRELFERLSEYLDGELPADLCGRMDEHMGDCQPCQRFLESLRRTVRLVDSESGDTLPEAARRDLLAAARRLRED